MTQAVLAQGTGQTSGGSGTTSPSGSTSGGSCSTSTRQISLHIPDESAPPGGVVQMKLLVTEPSPVSSSGPRIPIPTGTSPIGIQLFDPSGDVNGVALVGPSLISVASVTSTGPQG